MNNNLKLIKSDLFNNVKCDFWRNENGDIFMTIVQLAQVLDYASKNGIEKLIANNKYLKDEEFSIISEILTGTDGKGSTQKTRIFTEDGIYEVTMLSKQPKAKDFRAWVRKVMKGLRKGELSLVMNDNLPSYMIENPKERAKRWIEEYEEKEQLALENKELAKEVEYKEDVIVGLVDTITLAEKRQLINRVVRSGGRHKIKDRWNELYKQFEDKYHINLKIRLERYNTENKPKLRNKLDYIDKKMNKIPELYDIACKLYENDIKVLIDELYQLQK